MIHSHNTWGAWFLCFCLLAAHSVNAQSLQRKVFSPAGSVFSHNGQEYGFTIGEPMIGTDLLTIPYLTKGFQQPEPLSILFAPVMTLHQVISTGGGVQLNWSSSHHEQTAQYLIEYAIEGGSFVFLEKVLPEPGSQPFYQTNVAFPADKRIRFKVIQELVGGIQISSNVLELVFSPASLSWRLYPNPASENDTKIVFGAPLSGNLSIEIFTQIGQLVRKDHVYLQEESDLIISTEQLASGIYLVKVDHPDAQGVRRLIVEK
ncbi:MAG: T9SS type A sorting domain-containing protein [Bacteroidia bacterium]|nr:T9SS type A sorting domain-containing protein [Bacteroidia bacterium]